MKNVVKRKHVVLTKVQQSGPVRSTSPDINRLTLTTVREEHWAQQEVRRGRR